MIRGGGVTAVDDALGDVFVGYDGYMIQELRWVLSLTLYKSIRKMRTRQKQCVYIAEDVKPYTAVLSITLGERLTVWRLHEI